MAIAFDTATGLTRDGTSETSFSITHTAGGANRLAIATVGIESTSDLVTSVTYDGVAMTRVTGAFQAGTGRSLYTYYLIAPSTTASANVTVSVSSATNITVGCVTYTGAKQSGFPDATNITTITAVNPSGSVTTIADNCWVFLSGQEQSGNANPSAGSGDTLRGTQTNSIIMVDSNSAVTPAGSYSMTLTGDGFSRTYAWQQISFAPAAAAATAGALLMASLALG